MLCATFHPHRRAGVHPADLQVGWDTCLDVYTGLLSAASGTDRTRYSTRRKVFSFKSHHSQRISLGIVKADSRGILDSFGRKANLLSRA